MKLMYQVKTEQEAACTNLYSIPVINFLFSNKEAAVECYNSVLAVMKAIHPICEWVEEHISIDEIPIVKSAVWKIEKIEDKVVTFTRLIKQ